MTSWQTFGHNQVKNILERQLTGGGLAHAYLFSGPIGVGKYMLALEFAQKVLGAQKLELHPDFLELNQAEEITVEAVRVFMAKLSFKPFLGPKKVAIINNADSMNTQSANALLKTLEEPSPSTVIILVGDGQKLPATIRSRCQILSMQVFDRETLENFAKNEDLKVSGEMLDLCFGSPARLKEFLANADLFKHQQQQIADWQELRLAKPAEKFLAIGDLAELETVDLRFRALNWLFYEQSKLRAEPKNYYKVEALTQAYSALLWGRNKKSVLQSLFLKI